MLVWVFCMVLSGGDFFAVNLLLLWGRRAVWSVLVALPGSRFSPSKQNRGPSLKQPVASPGHFCRGAVSGRATRSVKGAGDVGREGSGTGGMAKDFSTFPTTSLHDIPFPAFPPSTEWLRFFFCRRCGVSTEKRHFPLRGAPRGHATTRLLSLTSASATDPNLGGLELRLLQIRYPPPNVNRKRRIWDHFGPGF